MSRRALPVPQVRPLSPADFPSFQSWIHRESGIFLTEAKLPLVVRRLSRRIAELGLDSFSAYLRHARQVGEDETIAMLDCICTNETQFFREPKQFDFLSASLLPALAEAGRRGERPRRLRVWCAAASTGEEPYSVAMALREAFGGSWQLEIVASDLSTRALERARDAVYTAARASHIPENLRRRYLLRGKNAQEGKVRAAPELRELVRFERINLAAASYPVAGPFDLVFCRNVLIYFDPATRGRVTRQLAELLPPGGHLFLGHAENATAAGDLLEHLAPNVYRRRPNRSGGGAEGGRP